jgi:hypothetical protein
MLVQPRPIVSYAQDCCAIASPDSLWLVWLVHGLPDSRLRRKAHQFAYTSAHVCDYPGNDRASFLLSGYPKVFDLV